MPLDIRQSETRVLQDQINAIAKVSMDSTLASINSELTPPGRISAQSTLVVTVGPGSVTNPNTSRKRVLSPVNNSFVSFSGGTLTFPSSPGGGTITNSNGSNATIAIGASQFCAILVAVNGSGQISLTVGSPAGSLGTVVVPSPIATALPLGYVVVQSNGSSVIQNITNAMVYQIQGGAGASGDTGSGLGDDLSSLRYKASFLERFQNTDAVDVGAGKTDATLFSSVSEYFRLAYDATRTVTGTGTSMTLSGAPSFTIKAGDILRVGTQARRITAITSQTVFTIEAAFSADPSASACCISQAVYSVDINNFAGDGLSAASQIATSISSALVFYRETVALDDKIFDFGAPKMAFTASADGSSYTEVQFRTTNLTDSTNTTSMPVAGTNLYLRFFPYFTSGSGFANLLDYKVFFHDETVFVTGDSLDQAYGLSDNSGTSNCSISSSTGKTRVTLTWGYSVGVNSGKTQGAINVFLDGKLLPRYVSDSATPGAYYKEISGNVIELDDDYSGLGLSIQVTRPVAVVDNTSQNEANIAAAQEMASAGFQGFVNENALLTASASPGANQFLSTVISRAAIPDIRNDLKARIGIDRIQTQQIYEIQNEFGPNGERVWGVLNDDRNLIRFVGQWKNTITVNGVAVGSADGSGWVNTSSDYIEVTFYGTGLNFMFNTRNGTWATAVTVDGVGVGNVSMAGSEVLFSRNYPTNIPRNACSGLALGVHTVRFSPASGNSGSALDVFGFEILNEASTINVRPGAAYVGNKKLVSSSAQSIAFNSSFDQILRDGAVVGSLGARGARVVTYIDSDGSIKKRAVAVNSAQANLSSADHTNEEVVRSHNWREFGAGRSDDFSTLQAGAGSSNRAFTLDDGTTTLVGQSVSTPTSSGVVEGLTVNTSSFFTLTFVGTGLDVLRHDASTGTTMSTEIFVDGSSIGVLSTTGDTSLRKLPIVSGLSYGTHTVRFVRNTANVDSYFSRFLVYGPKKPSLPSGAVELADYNVMADFVANSTAGTNNIATGVLRKVNTREMVYSGTWAVANGGSPEVGFASGWQLQTTTASSYVEYSFFGTGFEFRFAGSGTGNSTVSVDGSTNLSSFSTSIYGTSVGFTASTGVLTYSVGTGYGLGLRVSGLTLGRHVVRVTYNSGGRLEPDTFDIITPIHSPRSSVPADLQNTLPVGSCALSDSRKVTPIKSDVSVKYRGIAQGVASGPSTSSTSYVPLADMSLVVFSRGGWFRLSYSCGEVNNSTANNVLFQIYLNGTGIGTDKSAGNSSNVNFVVADSQLIYLSYGTHKIDLYWRVTGGTGSANSTRRTLTAEEL